MAVAVSTGRVWTYANLEDLPDDGLVYDILGGELVVRNAPDWDHAEVLTDMLIFLVEVTNAGYGRMYTTSTAVALDYPLRGEQAQDVPHPDLFFVRQERLGMHGDRGFHGVPDLVIEVLSRSTQSDHRPGGRWWDAYARNGVPHYWHVDPRARTIRQFALKGEPYVGGTYDEPAPLREGDTLTSSLFPPISVPVARIFRYVRKRT